VVIAATVSAIDQSMRRDLATWYSYLALGFFTYLLTIQGNILPFLKQELDLSYRVVSLHSAAIAAGMIAVGLLGDRVVRRFGRRVALALGAMGAAAGAVLLCLAPFAWASIASCALIGALGALIPAVVPALLADLHGPRRHVAITEASAASYAFAMTAPLLTSLSIAVLAGWRPAVLAGALLGVLILVACRRAAIVDAVRTDTSAATSLPVAYWAYWCLLVTVIAIEFCVLLWAPTFLGRVAGLPQAHAASAAAAFALAMLLGRTAGSGVVRHVRPQRLFAIALLVTALGFLLYWGAGTPLLAVIGLFVLGLGVALLYPLTLGFAIGAAGERGDTASARFMLAAGLAIASMPVLLGALADEVGLRSAHLLVPALAAIALVCFRVAQALERSPTAPARGASEAP
jgi:MFS transporter, DHA1 family, inner membrane transport protein